MKNVIKFSVAFLYCFFLSFFQCTNVLASSQHIHHVRFNLPTPFEKVSDSLKIHCLANKHSMNNPCPHHINGKDKISNLISSSCGSSPFHNEIISYSFAKDFLSTQDTLIPGNLNRAYFFHYHLKITSSFFKVSAPPTKLPI